MVRTRRPPVLLIHPHFRFIVFVTPISRANTPSIQRNILNTRNAQTGISKDSDVGSGHQGEHSGEGPELKGVMAVSKRGLNRIAFSAGELLCSPQPGFGSRNSEALVVQIELARLYQHYDARSMGMRSVLEARDRVRLDTCPWK